MIRPASCAGLRRDVLPPGLADALPDHDELLARALTKIPTVLGFALSDDSKASGPQMAKKSMHTAGQTSANFDHSAKKHGDDR